MYKSTIDHYSLEELSQAWQTLYGEGGYKAFIEELKYVRSLKYKKRLADKTGQKFGRLTANSYNYRTSKWECICECGNHKSVSAGNLSNGRTKSCGCLKVEFRRERMKQMWKDGILKPKQRRKLR
tara:strand:+ start:689 stop:1063 length:375 start_codon:yes stop_codon:yes gene_type:complete